MLVSVHLTADIKLTHLPGLVGDLNEREGHCEDAQQQVASGQIYNENVAWRQNLGL